jgi:hypothetical protein
MSGPSSGNEDQDDAKVENEGDQLDTDEDNEMDANPFWSALRRSNAIKVTDDEDENEDEDDDEGEDGDTVTDATGASDADDEDEDED